MTDISADIMRMAEAVTKTMPKAFGWRKITDEVAKAILAERSRCATKAHEWMHDNGIGANAADVALYIMKPDA